jgi:hypothetical protein
MNWFKKYFIPHKGNEFKPHLLREASVFAIFSFVILFFFVAVSGRYILSRLDLTALVLPKVLVDYANEDRTGGNYRQLAVNSTLEAAAQLKANDMASKGYFAHTSPEGHSPWYWFQKVGYDFSYAGENLAVNFSDSVDVNQAWMNSPGHRANIMNGNFTEIGIATAQGYYQGRSTIFVVQLFGTPAQKLPVSKPVSTTTKTLPKNSTTVTKIATTSTVVLSESTSTNLLGLGEGNELFIAVEKKSASSTVPSNTKYSNTFERILVSPEKTLSFVYLLVALTLMISLGFAIFIEIKRQNPRMILLSIGLLIVILGLLYIYKTVIFAPLLIL